MHTLALFLLLATASGWHAAVRHVLGLAALERQEQQVRRGCKKTKNAAGTEAKAIVPIELLLQQH